MRNRVFFQGAKPEIVVERSLGDDPSARRAAAGTSAIEHHFQTELVACHVAAQHQSDVVTLHRHAK
jgi:adenylate kinase